MSTEQEQIESLRAELAAVRRVLDTMGTIVHDQVVANQSAWIEWRHGRGAEAGMQWIESGLFGPGQIPDEEEPYGKEPQAWFDANRAKPFPQCACGRPSNQLWMGHGACSDPCMSAARKKDAGSENGELLARGSVNLLDQNGPGFIAPKELDVVPPPAFGADNAGAVGIGNQLNQVIGNVELAEVASEHGFGVTPRCDNTVTVSEGFVLVPLDATEAMKVAGLRELNPLGGLVDWNDPDCLSRVDMADGWAAMLGARPQVPE